MGEIKSKSEVKTEQVMAILGYSWDHYSFVFEFVTLAPVGMNPREIINFMAECCEN